MSSSSDLFKLVGRILIENADAISAIDDTTEKAKGLAQTLQGTGTEADNTSKKLGSSGKLGSTSVWLGNMFTKLTDLGFGIGKFIGKTGFAHNSMMEQYQTAFGVLIGDAEKAQKLLDDLWIMAADTPMEMTGLAENARDLLNYGVAVEKIIPMLYMLGDASLGSQKNMDGITYALAQIKSYDQLRGQETMQLVESGFPILEMLSKTMGATTGELLDMREKGLISFDDVLNAFEYAVTDDRFAGAMDKYTKTFEGQKAKLSDNFAQTIGNLTLAFFELSKSDVIPKINETLEEFGTWVSENQETLGKMAEAVSGLITGGFDMMINAFTWMVENGNATAVAIGTIATAMTMGAIAAHPYAAAVLAVAAGLAMLAAAPDDPYAKVFDGYSNEDLDLLQRWIDAANEAKRLEDTMFEDTEAYQAATSRADALRKEVDAVEGLGQAYSTWLSGQPGYKGASDMYLNIPTKLQDDAEGVLQGELDGMTLESVVNMLPDMSEVYATQNKTLTYFANIVPTGTPTSSRWISNLPGHASGLDEVPYDNYIARLHKGEAVLNSTNAEAWRSGSMGGGTGRLEGMMAQMMTIMQQVAQNTSGGKQVVLDSGVLVGQLAPALDAQLGTISSRKGRRN